MTEKSCSICSARRRWVYQATTYIDWMERISSVPQGMEDVDFIALGTSIALKRNGRNYREIFPEIGLSPAQISRAEHAKPICECEFLLFCKWLEQEPEDFVLRSSQQLHPQGVRFPGGLYED